MLKKRPLNWLFFGWLFAGFLDLFIPHPQHVYISGPAILIPLAIALATTAASIGLEYLIAAKQKVSPVDRGKQDDIRISIPGYGEQVVWSRGRARGAPVWTWHTPIVHTTIVTQGHGGGKGPPKPPTPTTVDHIYTKSVGGKFHDGEIQAVRRIWFNSEIVWNTVADQLSAVRYEAESATLAGTATITAASYASGGAGVTLLGNGAGNYVEFSVNIIDDGDYDIGIFYQSDSATLNYEVWLDGVSQGTVSCPPSGVSLIAIQTIGFPMTAGTRVIRFGNTSASCPNLDCVDVVETVSFGVGSNTDSRVFTELIDPTITPPSDQIKPWPYYNARPIEIDPNDPNGGPLPGTTTLTANLAKWGSPQIRIYRGTADQPADPAVIADKGVNNAPAWRGFAYIVIEGIQLPNGALPNVTIEWDQGTTAVDQIVEDLYALGDIDSSKLDLSALSGLTITGVMRTSQKAIGDTLKDLQTRFQFDMIEVDGIIKAVLRNRTTADLTIPYTELRAYADGSQIPEQDATIKDIDPMLLPYEVQVNYLDPGNDYHNGVQSDNRASGPQTEPISISLALVDDKHSMKKLASSLLYKPDMEGREFEIATGPKYNRVIPGSILNLQLLNATHTVRVADAKYSLPAGVCTFQCVRQAASLYNPTGFGSLSGRENPIAGFPSNTKGIILDGPLFRPEDQGDGTEPVTYIGLCGIGGGAWSGGYKYVESPFGSNNFIFSPPAADKPASIGITSGTALPSMAITTETEFTVDSSTDVITATAHGFVANDSVTVRNVGGVLPGGLIIDTKYYVRDVTVNTFKLSATTGGTAINITSNGTGTQYAISMWDRTSSLGLNFYHDPLLSSASEDDVEDNPNLNLLAIKNPTSGLVEVVQFKTATPGVAVSPFVAKYTVDHFLRGRFETQNNVGAHTSADEVVVVDTALKVQRWNPADIDRELKIKFVTSGQSVDNVPETTFTLHGYSLQARAVSNVIIVSDGGDDTLIQFDGNPRINEEPADYTVEAWPTTARTNEASILRTLPVTTGSTHAALLVGTSTTGSLPPIEQ